MIKEIHMKSCATYDSEGVALTNCPKVNFIYGPNGSGKSTISNYLQNPSDSFYAASNIVWTDELHVDIMVYNRRFREQNFKSDADIAGVFTLGSATIEDMQRLDELKSTRDKRKVAFVNESDAYKRFVAQREKVRQGFRDTVWNVILKGYDNCFKEAFSGFRNNKDKFRDHVLQRFLVNHTSDTTIDDLILRSQALYASKPEECPRFPVEIDLSLRAIGGIEEDSIFGRVIAGNQDIPIGKLIQSLQNSDWVNRGRQYIEDTSVCPFCQSKTINDAFREQLEAFFSGEYEESVAYIERLFHEYKQHFGHIVTSLKSVLDNKRFCQVGRIDVDVYVTQLQLLENIFAGNLKAISAKKEEPGRVTEVVKSGAVVGQICQMIKNANLEIDKHNQMVLHLSQERKKLADDIWAFLMDKEEALIQGYLDDEAVFNKAREGRERKLRSLKDELDQLKSSIADAGKKITSVQPAVDAINRSLLAYGFDNFRIEPSPHNPNMYQIQRIDGSLATNTLSEGEETFITFLYFMQLANGAVNASAVSNKRILVIDDPICSLDSTILYVVSAMVKTLIKSVKAGTSNIEQLFILTHNVFFHKEASFVNGRSNPEAAVNFWVLRKNGGITSITAHGIQNPISTSYELLWQELRSDNQTSFITVQNTMRRIIENYFGMLGGAKEDYVVERFETIEEQMICRSLFHWINDGSHSIPDDLFFDNQTASIDRYKEVFRRIFVVTNHQAHYDMMMGLNSNP